jgi:nudix-type nucleoside diphosphatase (YffH/AdpP family)
MAEIVCVDEIYSGWSRFRLVRFRLDDGEMLDRLVEDHGRAAVVLPYDPDRKVVLLVRQFRPGPAMSGEESGPEAPAGLIESGEDGGACARREAFEETGLRLGELEPIGRYWSSPGTTTEASELFLACYAAADRQGPGGGVDAQEHIEVVETPLAELDRRLAAGELGDLKLLALVQALKLRRPELFPSTVP